MNYLLASTEVEKLIEQECGLSEDCSAPATRTIGEFFSDHQVLIMYIVFGIFCIALYWAVKWILAKYKYR